MHLLCSATYRRYEIVDRNKGASGNLWAVGNGDEIYYLSLREGRPSKRQASPNQHNKLRTDYKIATHAVRVAWEGTEKGVLLTTVKI